MAYDFTKNETIKVIQVHKSEVPAEFIAAIERNLKPEWKDRGDENEHIYSIDEAGTYLYWENQSELDPHEEVIEALELASAALEAEYFQFVD